MPPKLRATQQITLVQRGSLEKVCCESSQGSRHNSLLRKECCPESKSSSRSKSKSSSRPDSPDDTPSWAKKPLAGHKRREERLQFLEKDLKSRPSTEHSHARSPQPVFKYKRNKNQSQLNEKEWDKLDVAASTSNEKAWIDALEEGRKILKKRNKHYVS